jgi:hypothetical protein
MVSSERGDGASPNGEVPRPISSTRIRMSRVTWSSGFKNVADFLLRRGQLQLATVELAVEAAGTHQVVMISHLDDAALLQSDDLVRVVHGAQPVGDDPAVRPCSTACSTSLISLISLSSSASISGLTTENTSPATLS